LSNAAGYGELPDLSARAAEGDAVETFHMRLARVQKAGTDDGLYGAGHVAGGRLWLARVSREGATARPVADLETPG
jgi:hypothetical protein